VGEEGGGASRQQGSHGLYLHAFSSASRNTSYYSLGSPWLWLLTSLHCHLWPGATVPCHPACHLTNQPHGGLSSLFSTHSWHTHSAQPSCLPVCSETLSCVTRAAAAAWAAYFLLRWLLPILDAWRVAFSVLCMWAFWTVLLSWTDLLPPPSPPHLPHAMTSSARPPTFFHFTPCTLHAFCPCLPPHLPHMTPMTKACASVSPLSSSHPSPSVHCRCMLTFA